METRTHLRTRLIFFFLLAASPAALVSAGGVVLLDRLIGEEIRTRGTEIFRATDGMLAMEGRRVDEAVGRIAQREELLSLAELVDSEDEIDRAEAAAGPLATMAGLDLLGVVAARGPREGTILASAHLATAAGDPAPAFAQPSKARTGTTGFAHELVAGNPPAVVPALVSVHAIPDRRGRPALIVYGGTRLDGPFLDLFSWTRGATLVLTSPGLRARRFPEGRTDHEAARPGGAIALNALPGGLDIAEPGAEPGRGTPRIAVEIRADRLEGTRQRFAVLAGGLVLAAFAGALAAGTWLSRRITEPILELASAASEIGAGRLEIEVRPGGEDEVGALIAIFNQMTRELRESRERLARAERVAAWREAARRVAHEIKNPLSPMKLAMETLRKAKKNQHPAFDEILEESTRAVLEEVAAISRIVGDFSEFARLPKPRLAPVSAVELLEHAARLWGAPREGVRVLFDADAIRARGVPRALADRDQVTRALINLVKNAIEAIGERGGTVTLDARAESRGGRAGVSLSVADDGPGMSEEVRAKIFTPYFTTKQEGTGLGLAIVEHVVQEHEGALDLDSSPGAGTVFRVWLPAALDTVT